VHGKILNKVRRLHIELTLCFQGENALLNISDDFLVYLLCLLRNETPFLPESSFKEWADLLTLLIPHKMLPILYWKIGRLPKNLRPPEPIIDKMRKSFMTGRVHALQAERQLQVLLDAFSKAGIRVLVLKGPALARTVYPNPAMRPSNDIDLLVRPREFPKAREIMSKNGYQCDSKIFEILEDSHCEEHFIPLRDSRNNRIIELHWDLHRFFGYAHHKRIEELFFRAITVKTTALCFETLHPIDALIYAALHLIMSHSQSMRLIWIYDIALLAQNLCLPNDWDILQKRSFAWGARLSVEYSIKMAHIWADLQLPKSFNDFSTWPGPEENEIVAVTNAIHIYDRPANLLKLYLSCTPSFSKKLHILFKVLFPDLSYIRNTYPSSREWLLPFSYLRRLWKWR